MSTDTPNPAVPIDPEADLFADPRKLTKLPVAFPTTGGGTMPGYVEVREEISIGEQRKAYADAVKGQVQTPEGPRTEYDNEKLSFALTVLHVVDWSLKRAYSPAALRHMKPPIYKVIDDAVRQHIERVTEGNAPTPLASGDSPTSTSAV